MSEASDCQAETMKLTADEVVRLEGLPDAAFEVRAEIPCELEAGHAGPHVGLGQSQDHGGDDQTNWWMRWAEGGVREWTHEPACPVESGDEECLLPSGHAGVHRIS